MRFMEVLFTCVYHVAMFLKCFSFLLEAHSLFLNSLSPIHSLRISSSTASLRSSTRNCFLPISFFLLKTVPLCILALQRSVHVSANSNKSGDSHGELLCLTRLWRIVILLIWNRKQKQRLPMVMLGIIFDKWQKWARKEEPRGMWKMSTLLLLSIVPTKNIIKMYTQSTSWLSLSKRQKARTFT